MSTGDWQDEGERIFGVEIQTIQLLWSKVMVIRSEIKFGDFARTLLENGNEKTISLPANIGVVSKLRVSPMTKILNPDSV